MSNELLIDCDGGELRVAVMVDDQPRDLIIESAIRTSLVGNIYLGRVRRVLPGLGAAFVDFGGVRDGFLPLGGREGDGEPAPALVEGETVCVQVIRDAYAKKGPQLSRRLTIAGRYLVYAPDSARVAISRQIEDEATRERLLEIVEGLVEGTEGFVVRTAADGADENGIEAEAPLLRDAWDALNEAREKAEAPVLLHRDPGPVERALRDHGRPDIDAIRVERGAGLEAARNFCKRFAPDLLDRLCAHGDTVPLFEAHGVEDAIAAALERRVSLPSGGAIIIDQTEALCAIDVDSARSSGGTDPVHAAFSTNLEAAVEVARQVRLRNIGGLIVVDFIHAEDDDQWNRVFSVLAEGFADDRNPCRILGRTAGGLVEMTRRRRREGLRETMFLACEACIGTGLERRPATVAADIVRALRRDAHTLPGNGLGVHADALVVDALRALYSDGDDGLSRAIGRPVRLNPRDDYDPEAFDIFAE
ncbi:MAG: Rne/Rng family ribonuclease [Alphaproteobacteria bacterium]